MTGFTARRRSLPFLHVALAWAESGEKNDLPPEGGAWIFGARVLG